MSGVLIRKIEPKDNQTLKTIIKSVFHEINIPLKGTAYEDPETSNMYEAYSGPRSVYYVVEKDGKVLGGAGIKPLKGEDIVKEYAQPRYKHPIPPVIAQIKFLNRDGGILNTWDDGTPRGKGTSCYLVLTRVLVLGTKKALIRHDTPAVFRIFK